MSIANEIKNSLEETRKAHEKADKQIGAMLFQINFLRLLNAEDYFSPEQRVRIKNIASDAAEMTEYEIGYKPKEQ